MYKVGSYTESCLTTWRKSSSCPICGSLTSESKRTGTGLVSREDDPLLLLALDRTRIGIARGGGQRPRAAMSEERSYFQHKCQF